MSSVQLGAPPALVVTAVAVTHSSSALARKPSPPREGCHAVSKIKYDSAKREYC